MWWPIPAVRHGSDGRPLEPRCACTAFCPRGGRLHIVEVGISTTFPMYRHREKRDVATSVGISVNPKPIWTIISSIDTGSRFDQNDNAAQIDKGGIESWSV